jgi:hypothetical protein
LPLIAAALALFVISACDLFAPAPSNTTTYTLTVTGGSGSGDYAPGTVVDIVADAPTYYGTAFSSWSGGTSSGFANASAGTTTYTTGSANETIVAGYASTGAALPYTFESTLDSTNWSVAAGYQNGATVPAVALDTTVSVGAQSAAARYFTYTSPSSANKFWPDNVDLGAQSLHFVLRTDDATANGGSHIVLTLNNVNFGDLTGKTGIEFVLNVPGGPINVGVSPIIRYNDGTNENAQVYSAPLNDAAVEDFASSGSVYDWMYFGTAGVDNSPLHIKIPFSAFSVPGWAGTGHPATIADALAQGVIFNEFNIDFRMDASVSDGSGGAANTNYDGYIDNIATY